MPAAESSRQPPTANNSEDVEALLADGRNLARGHCGARWGRLEKFAALGSAGLLVYAGVAVAGAARGRHGFLRSPRGDAKHSELGAAQEPAGAQALYEDDDGSYECHDEVPNWRMAWSPEKKRWCCLHEHRGCGGGDQLPDRRFYSVRDYEDVPISYDCTAGYTNWQAGWSELKKHYCCEEYGFGCEPSLWEAYETLWIILITVACVLIVLGVAYLIYKRLTPPPAPPKPAPKPSPPAPPARTCNNFATCWTRPAAPPPAAPKAPPPKAAAPPPGRCC
mmetsp:Transcript_85544/g.277026  ORF Transcript_85544/g.277026 Transcript_85544/m.277026 type:complete len:278 (-) Transcript_85544:193-1026(-)